MQFEGQGRFFETILRCVADGVFTVDRDWRITSFNKAAERITGMSARQAMGKRCSEVFHADLCGDGCAIRRALETKREVIEQPANIRDQRGRAIPISISAAVLRGEDGTVLGGVETFRDLSAIEQLRREIRSQYTFEEIVGKSEAFQKVFSILPDVAASESTVLIEGPSGSGKQLLARTIHNLSPRRDRPYVVANCGMMPSGRCASELFGHVRGAFKDAKGDRLGRIAQAEGGTIFLDEIGDLSMESQVRLLKVLRDGEYEPLGGVSPRRADVRVVAATSKSLPDLVGRGLFRDDLYFRLAVVRLSIPPLSERREDIPCLVEHFVQRFNAKRGKSIQGVTPAAMELLMRHGFPGNVRELENLIECGFALCHGGWMDVGHLPEDLRPSRRPGAAGRRLEGASLLRHIEADAVRASLGRNAGHLGRTAEELGISRTTLWRKMNKYAIEADEFRAG
ncbi:MAG: sigma 54-interacting transcriptional regulator [Elusimicrobiota bacterium]